MCLEEYLSFKFFSGNYFLHYDASIIIQKHHIYRSKERGESGYEWGHDPEWTFNTTIYFKIGFNFVDYYCYSSSYCSVKIGDGSVVEESVLLDHTASSAPNNVTSSSNTAWLKVRSSLYYYTVQPPIPVYQHYAGHHVFIYVLCLVSAIWRNFFDRRSIDQHFTVIISYPSVKHDK